jgi:hypothetical protein
VRDLSCGDTRVYLEIVGNGQRGYSFFGQLGTTP